MISGDLHLQSLGQGPDRRNVHNDWVRTHIDECV